MNRFTPPLRVFHSFNSFTGLNEIKLNWNHLLRELVIPAFVAHYIHSASFMSLLPPAFRWLKLNEFQLIPLISIQFNEKGRRAGCFALPSFALRLTPSALLIYFLFIPVVLPSFRHLQFLNSAIQSLHSLAFPHVSLRSMFRECGSIGPLLHLSFVSLHVFGSLLTSFPLLSLNYSCFNFITFRLSTVA